MELNRHPTKSSPLPHSNSNSSTSQICIDLPSFVNSKGLWVQYNDPQWWFNASLPLVELQLILFCISLVIAHNFLKRFGVSKISSQIIIGLIFGCSWNELDKAKLKYFKVGSQDVLSLLADLGFTLFLFLSAVKTDVTMTLRTGKTALLIGIPALLVPTIFATFLQSRLVDHNFTKEQLVMLPLLITFHGTSSFPVVASLVSELRIVNSELGRLGLSSALVSDLLGLFIMVTTSQTNRYHHNPSIATVELGALIFLFVVILFVFRPAMLWIIKQTPQGMPVSSSYIQVVILMALASTVLSNFTDQASIIGAYLLGLAVPDGDPLASTLVAKTECLVSDILMPILVATCALRADVSQLSASFDDVFTKLNVILICVTFAVKVVTCVLSSTYCKLPFKDSLALSLIMSSKGSVELVLYTLAKDYRFINDELFDWCVISIMFTATLVPVAVRGLYDPSRKYAGYQNRNIMHLNPASDELRLLACVHQNENINAIVHLLNISCPTVENPLAVHIFHLIELSGRSASIFISHKLQNNPLYDDDDDRFYSRHIIHSFNQFERANDGTVCVECFTAVSPSRDMHDDICTLALDKIASLIILPFHRTWTIDGHIDNDDNMIRTLNYSVLERAPCSIGIFVDRGNLGSIVDDAKEGMMRCAYSVCVIFLGGKDDREAISYAKRMTRDPRVKLTVVRLAEASSEEDNRGSKRANKWEDLVDSEVVNDFKGMCLEEDERVMFIEEVCRDGQEAASILRKIVSRFDLMIVGRRNGLESGQTAGLNEWNEFPELGVLGDLIASTDINTTTSLLVIQQQKIM